ELVLPEASVVNCQFPAACGMRWSTAMRLHDLVLGALDEALPGSVPAAGAGQVVVTYVSTVAPGRAGRVVVANPVVGGTGGGPELDGESGIDFPCAFLRNVPVEVLEAEVPVVVQRFGIVPDSEGAGRCRGGFGVEYAFTLGDPRAVVVMRGKDRHRFVPWGVAGGKSGSAGDCFVLTRDGRRAEIGKTTVYRATFGDTVHIRGSGGGGYGDPNRRDAEAVAGDVADGRISPERAREHYGVVAEGGELDREATARLRAQRPASPPRAVDVGVARAAFERQLGPLSAELSRWLPTLPAAVRHVAKVAAYGIARAELEGGAGTLDVARVIAAARDEVGGATTPSAAH
ncbi:MAG TPA: hydantoinase B/oxoprolinase family protein, partial [Acidimicrobiales bacterium]|nr:hydantoinase B/oxoprolinase family protein [Acidimicrobiales bacterium]